MSNNRPKRGEVTGFDGVKKDQDRKTIAELDEKPANWQMACLVSNENPIHNSDTQMEVE